MASIFYVHVVSTSDPTFAMDIPADTLEQAQAYKDEIETVGILVGDAPEDWDGVSAVPEDSFTNTSWVPPKEFVVTITELEVKND